MTLPASGVISLTDVMNEIRLVNPGRQYPISLGDSDVRALANVPSGTISLTNLYGKSSYIPMTVTGINDSTDVGGTGSGGTATCFPSVSVSGGSGGYTFNWIVQSQSGGCTFIGFTSQTISVSHTYSKFASGNASANLSCTVTDNTGHQVTVFNVNGYLSWDNGN